MLNRIYIFLLFNSLICVKAVSQTDQIDIELLLAKQNIESTHNHSISPIKKESNLLDKVLFGSLNFYKKNISSQISAECLYEISCSTFSQMALKEYGMLKGIALTADRLARCNRISGTTINEYRVNNDGKVVDSPSMYKLNN